MFNSLKESYRLWKKIRKEVKEKMKQEEAEKKAKLSLIGQQLNYQYLEDLFKKVQQNSDVHVVIKMQNGEAIEIFHGANENVRKNSIYEIPKIQEKLVLVG